MNGEELKTDTLTKVTKTWLGVQIRVKKSLYKEKYFPDGWNLDKMYLFLFFDYVLD